MLRTIVATGCDSAHYDLVADLLASLTDAGREGLDVGLVHVGADTLPPALELAVDRVAHVADDEFVARGLKGFRLAHLMIKPRLPQLFPGYDVYVWLDGDTWVQDRAGLDQIVFCAQQADLCAHPELDPNYFRQKDPFRPSGRTLRFALRVRGSRAVRAVADVQRRRIRRHGGTRRSGRRGARNSSRSAER